MAKDERLNIRISKELKEKFIDYVERNGYSQTGLIERLIKEELKKEKEAD
jgi:antitoxin component of RelBE/YafQ-DinJ toxin-antitoxin module